MKRFVHEFAGGVCHVGGVLLHDTHPLPDGSRIRLRLPHAADRAALHELLAEHGVAADDLDVRRALRWSPHRRVVVATRWDGACERVAGFAALDRERGGMTLIAPREVARVLRRALRDYADRRVA